MATKSIGPVLVAVLTVADINRPAVAALIAKLGDRLCREGGVLQDERLPYGTYEVTSNREGLDLEGPDGDCFADVTITVTSFDPEECDELARLVAAALQELAGTFAGVEVTDSLVNDVSDTPNGPIDSSDGEVYQSEVSATLEYKGS